MNSSGRLRGSKTGPLYFFDQPTGRRQIQGTPSNILRFSVPQGGTQLEETRLSNREDELPERLAPDTASTAGAAQTDTKAQDPTDAYKRAAPQLLHDLSGLLCQHAWTVHNGCIPHGMVNILSYTWQELTAGAVLLKSPEQPDHTCCLVSASDERSPCVVRKPPVSSNPQIKKRKQNCKIAAHDSTVVSFSISSNSCKGPGWIIQPQQPSCVGPLQISLCQWVLERLHTAKDPEKLQAAEQNQNKPLILRHYGDAKAKPKGRRAKRKAQPATLVFGIPRIPEVEQQDPAQKKLHYSINDGSSFIYYLSGFMAVCQSHSGLPCGGFYTNVFSDSLCPAVLATITAFGHGAVTHPLRSTITAVWDQDGGFTCDHLGNITKEWRWKRDHKLRGKIVIQLSDMISVRLFSGTSATLSFRCNNESVELPLSALSRINQSKEKPCLLTDGKLTSAAAQDLLLAQKSNALAVSLESKRNLTLTPVLQMAEEVERLKEPSAQWRRAGHASRELKRLQQRVRNTLDGWLAYYRTAIGIKCPDTKHMPDAPLRTRPRREVQSAALPSLNPPERTDAKPVQPEEGRSELQALHRQCGLSAPAERPPDSSMRLPRTPKKQAKEESHVTQIGPLQIHGNIQLESVIIQKSPESQPSTFSRFPAPLSFSPSTPLTLCPVLLRAALLGDGGRRRCCCSSTQMPVVTDLEYDAFVMGQPPNSQQILLVCVTLLHQPVNTQVVLGQETLEQLYRGRNKHRTMPCTQCQTDSFRMVRYEISAVEKVLLQQRHNAAPGMVLMYIRGKLLFVGYVFSNGNCSVRDLQKQISRSRGDYRLGQSLPPDYKFRPITEVPKASLREQKASCIKPKKTPAFPHVPFMLQ